MAEVGKAGIESKCLSMFSSSLMPFYPPESVTGTGRLCRDQRDNRSPAPAPLLPSRPCSPLESDWPQKIVLGVRR